MSPILFPKELKQYQNASSDSSSSLDSPYNRNEFYMVTDVLIIMFTLSCLGNLAVIYRTYKQWKFDKTSLKMAHKLPFYTSCSGLIENGLFLINIIHTSMYASVFEDPACKLISFVIWALITISLSLYSVMAVATYLRICHNYDRILRFGKYDYRLWSNVSLISVMFQLVNIRNHGSRKYWCAGKSGKFSTSILLFVLITISLVVILYCYLKILRKINHTCKNEQLIKHGEFEKKATNKVISYMIIFVLQWVFIQAQNLGRLFGVEHPWIYIIKGHAIGATGNVVQLIINEGWDPYKKNVTKDNKVNNVTFEDGHSGLNSLDTNISRV
ncbi:3875_t:CDS:2 [Funneliformis geosporum]|uniref:3875_t:CDS:1 n=1 Tax=Funneliformis geosporum TaxID=1117311 RepID=A0A9W4SNA6_9GLOM|nr:3875_t:CDS:2 [Funneliformis geosporum]